MVEQPSMAIHRRPYAAIRTGPGPSPEPTGRDQPPAASNSDAPDAGEFRSSEACRRTPVPGIAPFFIPIHPMKKLFIAVSLSLAFAAAHAAPVSQESIEALLAETKAESLIESLYGSIEQSIRAGMQQSVAGKKLTPEQQRAIEMAPAKLMAVLKTELNWTRMKPLYVQVYKESFTQEEIDGLLAFYRSPAGQAFVNKMPVVMQRSMQISQSQMQALAPKLQEAMKQLMQEAKIEN